MKIYHYTDLYGLKGIIESGSLWATHFTGAVQEKILFSPAS